MAQASTQLHFGGGYGGTFLSPIALLAMLLASIMILLVPRRYISVPILLVTFLIPGGQEIYLAGFHVFVLRIIFLIAWARIVVASRPQDREFFGGGWSSIDSAFLLFVSCHVVAFSLFYRQGGAIANQCGYALDYLGGYFLLRYLIRNEQDISTVVKCFAVLVVILAVCMIREQLTGQNIFGLVGGGTVTLISAVRDGHIRSQAVFQHSLLAGTFGATLLPLFIWLWKSGRSILLAIAAVIGGVIMVATSASSTPALALVAVIGALWMWPIRKKMRLVRWGIVFAVLALAAVMKAPVWFFIAHLGVFGGSSGSHRAELIDTFIRHFSEWWLLGTDSNRGWGFYMDDSSNAYVEVGVTGGLFALIFFLATISRAFRQIGIARKAVEEDDRKKEWFFWLLGVAVFSHVVSFFGVTYFDQTKMVWFALLAIIIAATSEVTRPRSTLANEPVSLEMVRFPLAKPITPKPEFTARTFARR